MVPALARAAGSALALLPKSHPLLLWPLYSTQGAREQHDSNVQLPQVPQQQVMDDSTAALPWQ